MLANTSNVDLSALADYFKRKPYQYDKVIDLTLQLPRYIQVIHSLEDDNFFLPMSDAQLSQFVEESVRQIFQDSIDSDFRIFGQRIYSRPNLHMLIGVDVKTLHPHARIVLEQAWKQLALESYYLCRWNGLFEEQKIQGTTGFSYTVKHVYTDGVYLEYIGNW